MPDVYFFPREGRWTRAFLSLRRYLQLRDCGGYIYRFGRPLFAAIRASTAEKHP